jgi:hypothetical protein
VSPAACIERLSATYVVSQEHPALDGVRARLDGVGRRLPEVLPGPLDDLRLGREREVWLFREVDVEVEVDLGADDVTIARVWADAVVSALARSVGAVGPGPGSELVVVFADRAEQLAALVCDLAAGVAADRWWHAEFGGLFVLAVPAAVVVAVTREPAIGPLVLERLAADGRLDDVVNVLGEAGCARVLEAVYPRAHERPNAPAALVTGASPKRATGTDGLPAARGRGRSVEPDTASAPFSGERTWAEFGGAFLLLRGLVSLGLDRVDPSTRLLALRAALGSDRALTTRGDEVLAWIAGACDHEEPVAFGPALLEGLLGSGRADGREVTIESTSLGLLLRDVARDAWLAAGGIDEIARAIDALTDVLGDAPAVLDDCVPVRASELAYLTLDDRSAAPAALGGRALIRDLTARLAGFERSSPEHVRRNFLDRGASVQILHDGLRVALSPAPLDVVLYMAGFDGLRFEVPWLGEIELSISR